MARIINQVFYTNPNNFGRREHNFRDCGMKKKTWEVEFEWIVSMKSIFFTGNLQLTWKLWKDFIIRF